MSTRREFARQVVGAIVGVSVVPVFGQKPKPGWIPTRRHVWPPITQVFPVTNFAKWEPYICKDPFLISPYVHLHTTQP